MPSSIQGGEYVCEQIVVCPYHKWCIHQVFLEMFCHAPLEHKDFQLRTMIVLLCRCQRLAPESYGMVLSGCFWESITPNPSFDVSVSRRNGLLKFGNTKTGVVCIVCFKTSTASHTLGGSCTRLILTSLPSMSHKGFARWVNSLMKYW